MFLSIVVKAICLSSLFFGISTSALAIEPQPVSHRGIRASHVIAHIERLGIALPWKPIGPAQLNASIITFSSKEYALYESQAYDSVNTTDLVEWSPKIEKRFWVTENCYGSGSWAYDSTLVTMIGQICGSFSFGVQEGSVQIIKILNDKTGNRLLNEVNDPMSLVSKFISGQIGNAAKDYCTAALTWVATSVCQGQHSDTRGGEVVAETTENARIGTFTIDPTTDNCNC